MRLGRSFDFVAVVIHVFSRKVIGYAIDPSLYARMPQAALDATTTSRTPPVSRIHYSERGSQYAPRR